MTFFRHACLILSISFTTMSFANQSVLGHWQTIDHKTNQPSSIVKISKKNDQFTGQIVKIFEENGHLTTDKCVKCKGKLFNQPMLGMNILHFKLSPEGKVHDCKVLDPNKGSVYHCTLGLHENGQILHLRGYIGISLLGRTDNWMRVNPKK